MSVTYPATGAAGDAGAETSSAAVASALGLHEADVLPCSTGVIGEPLHVDLFEAATPGLARALDEHGGDAFARAIMTTDAVHKQDGFSKSRAVGCDLSYDYVKINGEYTT